MTDSVIEKVLSTVASVKHIPENRVSVDSLLQDLEFDSLDTTVLLFELEKKFQISIPDEEVQDVRTVRDIVDGVARLLAKASQDAASAETHE